MKKVFFNDDLIEKILSRSLTHFINICKDGIKKKQEEELKEKIKDTIEEEKDEFLF